MTTYDVLLNIAQSILKPTDSKKVGSKLQIKNNLFKGFYIHAQKIEVERNRWRYN